MILPLCMEGRVNVRITRAEELFAGGERQTSTQIFWWPCREEKVTSPNIFSMAVIFLPSPRLLSSISPQSMASFIHVPLSPNFFIASPLTLSFLSPSSFTFHYSRYFLSSPFLSTSLTYSCLFHLH